ncbi:hypothetical protein [Corallococcus exercitus]|uniref:hypothetical protein n=1 Tax=Corallococcus exercitus TaxID=2316736 RepID=UPI0035D4E14D
MPGRPAFGVYGMAVDTAHDTLWACTYDDTLPPAQPSHLAAYSLTTGAQTLDLVMPGIAVPPAPLLPERERRSSPAPCRDARGWRGALLGAAGG